MGNQMVKRYPCRDYKRLLAAEALPMTSEYTIKADLKKPSIFVIYEPSKVYLKP